MTQPDTIRVAIVEDDAPTREGLGQLIDAAPGYACSGMFGSAEEALPSIARLHPDVLLLDINLPGMAGSEAAGIFRQRQPRMEIIMLTVYAEQDRIFESICNGASGYLLKKTPPDKLLEAIREARDGGAPMSPEIARKVVMLFRKTGPPAAEDQRLTPHEVRFLGLLSEGHSYKAAAARLGVSVNTVRNYVRSIYEKLHVHSKSEAVSKALRNRIIS